VKAGPPVDAVIEQLDPYLGAGDIVIDGGNSHFQDTARRAAALERVIEVLPAMKRPTLSRLHGIDYFSIQTVVQKGLVNGLIPALKAAGAEDILEIPITKIVR